jgi:hypothetical protein
MALFDLSSSWVTGRCCELAARGYSRDGKKGCEQIEYGILTDVEGRPVAVRVFPGNTGDPAAFTTAVGAVKDTFALDNLVMVGDRGMITTARIAALRELNEAGTDFGWITALRAPQVATLAADDGPLQMSLFDHQDLAEIAHPDYPGERLIACRNPALAAERARKRGELLAATENLLAPIIARVQAGRVSGAGAIGEALGRVIDKYKVAKHFHRAITNTSLTVERRHDQIAAEAALDGVYVLRTSVGGEDLDPAAVIAGYKNLANVERDFRILKVDDLDLRPIHHRLTDRVEAHVLICMLACYVVWHLRKAWAPMTFTDEHPRQRDNPVAPAQRSAAADAKASTRRDESGDPLRSFRGLLDHLATLTRNQVRYHGTDTEIPMLAEATADQRRAASTGRHQQQGQAARLSPPSATPPAGKSSIYLGASGPRPRDHSGKSADQNTELPTGHGRHIRSPDPCGISVFEKRLMPCTDDVSLALHGLVMSEIGEAQTWQWTGIKRQTGMSRSNSQKDRRGSP